MSNEKQETIADIVAWLRRPREGENAYLTLWRDEIADRIEAAWKREREAGAEAAQICGEIGEMIGREASKNQSVTNCNRLGNVAKMREALLKVKELFDGQIMFQQAVRKAHEAVNAALATPPRNCDRSECATTKEAQHVWSQEDGGKTAYYEWLLETSTKEEAK